MCVNGDTGTVSANVETVVRDDLITTKLLNEALNCPIAFVELVRQYGELSDEDRTAWMSGLVGGQSASIYYASQMHTEGVGGLLLEMAGLDVDTAIELVRNTITRTGDFFGFHAEEGGEIPEVVWTAANEYAQTL